MKNEFLAVAGITCALLAGCNRSTPGAVEASATPTVVSSAAPGTPAPVVTTAPAPAPAPALTIPSGTSFRVRLAQTLSTKRNRPGDHFTATLDEALVDGDRVVLPKGTAFEGRITQASASGRFKGRAVMSLKLVSFVANGQKYTIQTTSSSRASAAHGKHHAAWIGGGAGGGALIGAAAGGGAGALIGAGAGAAAGTIGSAITGKREVTLPVETPVRFTLQDDVRVG